MKLFAGLIALVSVSEAAAFSASKLAVKFGRPDPKASSHCRHHESTRHLHNGCRSLHLSLYDPSSDSKDPQLSRSSSAEEPSKTEFPTTLKSNLEVNKSSLDFWKIIDTVKSNVLGGDVGKRGEIYFALQASIILCILFGSVPFVGDILGFLLGPGLVFLGGTVATLAVTEIGSNNLTPWPVPSQEGSLVTEGLVYGEVRHPMYAGLIILMVGLSMWSGSAMRLLLSIALWYLVDIKSEFEEEELEKKFGAQYVAYREQVKGKFIPSSFVDTIEQNVLTLGTSITKQEIEEEGEFQ